MATAATMALTVLVITAASCREPGAEFQTVSPVPRDVEEALATNGRIEPVQGNAVHAAVGGEVERVDVRRGDAVTAGQPLLKLADSGQAVARTRASAALAAAKARLAQLRAGLAPDRKAALHAERSTLAAKRRSSQADTERLERLLASDAATRAEVEASLRAEEEIGLKIDGLDAQLNSPVPDGRQAELLAAVTDAEAALRAAESDLQRLAVRSPSDGVLYSLAVEPGDFVTAGNPVARVAGTESVRARIFVDEPDLGRVRPDSVATLTADAYPGREWACRMDRLATEVIELGPRRVGELQCTAENAGGALLPGMAVGVRIVTGRAAAVLSLPRSAVVREGRSAFVWTVERGRAVRRPVRLGMSDPEYVEVQAGVVAGERVVIPGGRPLQPNQIISVQVDEDADDD